MIPLYKPYMPDELPCLEEICIAERWLMANGGGVLKMLYRSIYIVCKYL